MNQAEEVRDKNYRPKPVITEDPAHDPSTGFDYRTHIKDGKTGKLIRLQQYARHTRNAEVLLERPIGSGNCWYENGVPAGRWKFHQEKNDVRWEKLSDTHTAVRAAPANELEASQQENEILRRELAAAQAELDRATAPTTEQKKRT